MGKLENKVALITGGNSGIGLATAKLFHEEGAKIIITASSKKSYENAKNEYENLFEIIQTDVTKDDELKSLFKIIENKYKKIDILFANAGIALFQPTIESDNDFYDKIMNVNLKALYFTVKYSLPILNKKSSVILTGSSNSIKGTPGAAIYSASKAAVRSLARNWTAEIPAENARFNVLSPGPIDTPIFQRMGITKEQSDKMIKQISPTIPAGRIGKPEEIAKVAVFLASDDSSYVMGSEFFADGGLSQI